MKNQHKNMGNHSNGFHEHERHTIVSQYGKQSHSPYGKQSHNPYRKQSHSPYGKRGQTKTAGNVFGHSPPFFWISR